ncbi:MAG: phage holin family protein [Tenericutes bacterium]|nr:phage holin family protein [Mycoplasmatota bacterium]MDD7629987.1 phage holin family protein [bacterium]MDO4376776.1 phage holin family protein [bacterium]MDY4108772.1 phage holin family protein [Bacilli bacterium]
MKNNINKILDFIITVLVYDLVLILVSNITNTLVIDSSYYGLYSLLGAIIICILNKTIKPILFKLTIPITGVTMGLFYPCLNILILKITDWILLSHFETHGIITLFLTSILISIINLIIEELIIKPIIGRNK